MKINRLLLADDHQFLLEGILTILKEIPFIEIITTVNNGYELMDAVTKHKPDMVILDLNMPGYDGLQCLEKIKNNHNEIKVLVLSNYNQPELVMEVKRMRADGYLVKNSSAVQLTDAVTSILSGSTCFPALIELKTINVDSLFFDEFLKKYQLTKREVEIIKMVCGEKSTKKIAAELFLSELTINTHRRNILRKIKVNNVAGLLNFAKQNQLL